MSCDGAGSIDRKLQQSRDKNTRGRSWILLVGDSRRRDRARDDDTTPWSPVFSDFEQRSGLRRARDGFSVKPTWYSYPIFPMGLMLDHGMISESLQCVYHTTGPDIGSDHRSVTLKLAIRERR